MDRHSGVSCIMLYYPFSCLEYITLRLEKHAIKMVQRSTFMVPFSLLSIPGILHHHISDIGHSDAAFPVGVSESSPVTSAGPAGGVIWPPP